MSNGLIQATSQGIVGTYKDGTLKVLVTIEPTDAAAAFPILGTPGAPLVIGQLTQEAARADLQRSSAKAEQAPVKHEQTAVKHEEMKGGELAKWAGILCADEYFHAWLFDTYSHFNMMSWDGSMEDKAKHFIYAKCGIQSRRDLDHNKEAGRIFREDVMRPFNDWRAKQ